MSLFNFFLKQNAVPTVEQEVEVTNDVTEEKNDVVMIKYGSGMPIDLIYGFLKKDYEAKGYDDALTNPDVSYKEMNKAMISSELEVKLRQVKLKYEDDMRELDFHIASRREAGLVEIVRQLEVRKEMLQRHMNELTQMEKDFENKASYMMGTLLSYERGFLKGMGAISLQQMNLSMNARKEELV